MGTLSVRYGEEDAPYQVDIFASADHGEVGPGVLLESMGFENRTQLALFFESGASMREDRYYRVKHTPRP